MGELFNKKITKNIENIGKTESIEWSSQVIGKRVSLALQKNWRKNLNFKKLPFELNQYIRSYLEPKPVRKISFEKLFVFNKNGNKEKKTVDIGETWINRLISLKDYSEGVFNIKSKKFRKCIASDPIESLIYGKLSKSELGLKFTTSLKNRCQSDFRVRIKQSWGTHYGVNYYNAFAKSKNLFSNKFDCEMISYINDCSEIMKGFNEKTATSIEKKKIDDLYKVLKTITVTAGDSCRFLENLYKDYIYLFIKESYIISQANGFEPNGFKVECITRTSELNGAELKFFMNLIEHPNFYNGVLPEGVNFSVNEIQSYLFILQTLNKDFLTVCSYYHTNMDVSLFTSPYLEYCSMLSKLSWMAGS